jgi:transposase InsO family protein
MVDTPLHLIAPTIALFAFYDRKYIRWGVVLAILTILPALDHLPFVFTYARALLHNVFELIPFAIIAAYGLWRKKDTVKHIGIIGGFYWASHIILDLDGVRMRWSLSSQIFVWRMDVSMATILMVPTGLPTMM